MITPVQFQPPRIQKNKYASNDTSFRGYKPILKNAKLSSGEINTKTKFKTLFCAVGGALGLTATSSQTKGSNLQKVDIPPILQDFKNRGNIPKKFFNQILYDDSLDNKTKASCFKYVEIASHSASDKISQFIEVKKSINTVNKIINNPDIDKRCILPILTSYDEKNILNNYNSLAEYKLDPMVKYTFAKTKNLSKENIEKHVEFTKLLLETKDDTPENCRDLAYFLDSYNKDFDINKLVDYIKSVDIAKLIKLEPAIKEFNISQFLNFMIFHRQKGVQEFTKEALTLPEDLTKFLEENPMGYTFGMYEVLNAYPCSDRLVGEIPDFWTVNKIDKEKIFTATENLANNIALNSFETKDTKHKQEVIETYRACLKNILKKEVEINRIGNGSYGEVYQIYVRDSQPVVIKLFFENRNRPECGPMIEIPNAVFANKHFPEHFSKFYCGKIPLETDPKGFVISEYLTPTPPAKFPEIKDKKWSFYYADGQDWNDRRGNIIGGKICDLGCLEIYNKETKTKNICFKLFEPWEKIKH